MILRVGMGWVRSPATIHDHVQVPLFPPAYAVDPGGKSLIKPRVASRCGRAEYKIAHRWYKYLTQDTVRFDEVKIAFIRSERESPNAYIQR